MTIIFQIDGGMGKCIAATAVCKAIKTQHPDSRLIVISGYPFIFLCNDYVDENLGFNELRYFYQQHIEGRDDVKMMVHNPYLETNFILGKGHLNQVWCEMFGIRYNSELPQLFINNRELNFYTNQFGKFQKPILLLQTNGGAQNQANKYSWTRDLPISVAQQLVNFFAKDYHILHIRREDQIPLENTTPVTADFRALAVLIYISHKRLFIDSFAQHAAAALGKPSVVCFTDKLVETQFGYKMHTNIIANKPTRKPELKHSVFSKYNITGQPVEFPYNHEGEIFNIQEIADAIFNLKNEVEEADEPEEVNEEASAANAKIKEKIVSENSKGSMVARRLACLADKVDISEIKQVLDIGSCHLGQSIEFSNVFRRKNVDPVIPDLV